MSAVVCDLSKFNSAMIDYKNGTGKTLEESCNRSLKNLLIHSIKEVEIAEKGNIEALKNAPWFNKKITTLLKGKFTKGKTRKRSNTAIGLKGTYSTSDYRIKWNQLAKTFISKRVRAIGFIKKLLSTAANSINAKDSNSTPFVVKIKGAFATFTKATLWKPSASISFGYNYEKRTHSGKGAEAIMLNAINKAISPTVADMEKYVSDKLKKLYKS